MGHKTQKSINIKMKQFYESSSLNYAKSSEQPKSKPALFPFHRPRIASSVLLAINFSLLADTYSGLWQTSKTDHCAVTNDF